MSLAIDVFVLGASGPHARLIEKFPLEVEWFLCCYSKLLEFIIFFCFVS